MSLRNALERDQLIGAELLVQADLEIERAFRIEVGVAAEAEPIAAVGRTKRRAGREDQPGSRGDIEPVLRVPGRLATEGLVIGVSERHQQVMTVEIEAILHVAHVDVGVLVEARAEDQ